MAARNENPPYHLLELTSTPQWPVLIEVCIFEAQLRACGKRHRAMTQTKHMLSQQRRGFDA